MKARLFAMSALSAVALVGTAYADGAEAQKSHWSGSVSLTSDYRFRGVSLSDNNPALQGGLQYNGSQGIYVGIWASSIDADPVDPGLASSEVDLYAGYDIEITENTTVGAGIVYYWYPNADDSDLNYFEIIGKVAHQMGNIGATLEVAYAPDVAGDQTLAVTGGLTAKVIDSVFLFSDGISASGHFGHQSYDETDGDYSFYDVGLTAAAGAFSLDVRYVGTDIDCGGSDLCDLVDGGVVVTGSLSFGD